jgi:polysaccharide biosynthesis protein PslG
MINRPRIFAVPQYLKFVVALICALMVFAAAAVAAEAGPQYRGAQTHSLWESVSSAEMTEELNALQAAGVNVLRVDVGWWTMEYAKGRYDPTYLAKLDALAAGAQARGIKIIATLWQTPPWASSGGAWNDPPSNPADYGAFARFITGRYGPELAAVEAWNEPNYNNNLIASNLAAVYTQMVKAFYTGAKEGDPNVAVLAGSMAYADISFLRELYANGIKGYYDGISFHPYADGAAPANTEVTDSFLGGIESLHAAQLAAGDVTPEWVTEFGWPTGTSRGANTEQQQAEYTEQAFALLDNLPYVEGATVYELRDMAANPSDPEDNFGMLRQNFAPTPAYAALKAAMQVTPGAAPPSPFQPGAPETGSGKSEAGTGHGVAGTPEADAPVSGTGNSGAGTVGPEGTSAPVVSAPPAAAPVSGTSPSGTGASAPSSPPRGAPGAGSHRSRGAHAHSHRRAHVASVKAHHLRRISRHSRRR